MQTLRSILALNQIPGIGAATVREWLKILGDLSCLFSESSSKLVRASVAEKHLLLLKNFDWKAVDAECEWMAQEGHHIVHLFDPLYPALLKQIASPPLVLFIRGNLNLLSQPQLAMVGSRTPSQKGRENAFKFAEHFARNGWVITSGLALGIDGCAHEGALSGRNESTIAVLGTGVDRLYPKAHMALAEKILSEGGAIVSEFPLGTVARPEYFPRRNRIISGLSLGTLVVEAALQSGSLITARYALNQNREVFAIPGSIHNPLAKGCHSLIKQGAKLAESAQDILEELKGYTAMLQMSSRSASTPKEKSDKTIAELNTLDAEHQSILNHLDPEDPTPLDVLVARTGLSVPELSSRMLMLEMEGYVANSLAGGYYRKC